MIWEINNYEKIGFKSLPFPRLELKNVKVNLKSSYRNRYEKFAYPLKYFEYLQL